MAEPSLYPLPRETRESAILACDGVSLTYGPFLFKVFDIADVEVWLKLPGAARFSKVTAIVAKVTGVPFDFFTVTFSAAHPASARYYVRGARRHERHYGVVKGNQVDAPELDKELSKQGTVIQELRRDQDGVWRAAPGEAAGILPAPALGEVPIGDGEGGYGLTKLVISEQDVTAVLAARDQTLIARDETVTTAAGVVVAAAAVNADAAAADADRIDAEAAALAALNAQAAALISETNAAGYALPPAVGSPYVDVATGLAATALNGTFWVYSAAPHLILSLYVDNGASATFIGSIETPASIQARIAVFEAQQVAKTRYRVGLQTTPVTDASNLSNGDFIFGDPAPFDGKVAEFGFFAKINGTVTALVRRRTGTGNDYTTLSSFACVVTDAPALKVFVPSLTALEGEFAGWFAPSNILPRPANANSDFSYFAPAAAGATVPTFTDATEANDFDIQAYAVFEKDTNLKTRMDAVELAAQGAAEKLNAVSFANASPVYSGIQTLPVIGVASSGGHYNLIGNFVDRHEYVEEIEWMPGDTVGTSRTNVEVWLARREGDDTVRIRRLGIVPVKRAVMARLIVNFWRKPGESYQFSFVRNGGMSHIVGDLAGYKGHYYGTWTTLSGGIVTDAFASFTPILQVRIKGYLAENRQAIQSDLTFENMSTEARLVKQSEPDAGDAVLAGAIIAFELPALRRGLGKKLRWYQNNIATTRWMLSTGNKDVGYTLAVDLGTNTYSAGLQEIDVSNVIIEPGYTLVGQGTNSGWVARQSATPNPGLHFLISVPFLDFFVPTNTLSNDLAQVSLIYDELKSDNVSASDTSVLDFSAVAWTVFAEQSWGQSQYAWKGAGYVTKVGALTGRNVVAYIRGGSDVSILNGSARNDDTLQGVAFHDVAAAHITIWCEGANDFLTQQNTLPVFASTLTQSVELFAPQYVIIASEGAAYYGTAGEPAMEAVAKRFGGRFVSRVAYFNEMCPVTYSGWHQGVWRSLTAGYHPGGRLMDLMVAQFLRTLSGYELPSQSRMIYRKRDLTPAPSLAALAYDEHPFNYHLLRKFKPLVAGERHQTVIGGYDDLQNVPGSPYTQTQDERFALQNGGTIDFGDYLLDVCTFDGTPGNTEQVTYNCPDPLAQVYLRTVMETPALSTDPAYDFVLLGTGPQTITDFTGRMDGNGKMVFICYNPSGLVTQLPAVTRTGKRGKPVAMPYQFAEPKGAALAGFKKDFIGLGLWTIVGTVNPDNDATLGLPDGRTWFVEVDQANYVKQVLPFATDALRSRRLLVKIQAHYVPDLRPVPAAVTPMSITEDTCNMRQIIVQLIDPAGVPVYGAAAQEVVTSFPAMPPALLAPMWVEAQISIPPGVPTNGLSIAITTDDIPADAKMRVWWVEPVWME